MTATTTATTAATDDPKTKYIGTLNKIINNSTATDGGSRIQMKNVLKLYNTILFKSQETEILESPWIPDYCKDIYLECTDVCERGIIHDIYRYVDLTSSKINLFCQLFASFIVHFDDPLIDLGIPRIILKSTKSFFETWCYNRKRFSHVVNKCLHMVQNDELELTFNRSLQKHFEQSSDNDLCFTIMYDYFIEILEAFCRTNFLHKKADNSQIYIDKAKNTVICNVLNDDNSILTAKSDDPPPSPPPPPSQPSFDDDDDDDDYGFNEIITDAVIEIPPNDVDPDPTTEPESKPEPEPTPATESKPEPAIESKNNDQEPEPTIGFSLKKVLQAQDLLAAETKNNLKKIREIQIKNDLKQILNSTPTSAPQPPSPPLLPQQHLSQSNKKKRKNNKR